MSQADSAILKDLTRAVEQAERHGMFPYVTTGRLREIMRKYEIQTVNDVSDQPGEWSIRGGNVDAIQHDGSLLGARHVQAWVTSRGGTADFYEVIGGSDGIEVDPLRLVLDTPRQPNIVNPSWWVVRTADGMFFTMPETDFHIIYVPRGNSDAANHD